MMIENKLKNIMRIMIEKARNIQFGLSDSRKTSQV